MAYLEPTMTGTQDQARSYLNQQRRQRGQQDFTDQEFQTLAGQVGYTGGNVTGAQINRAFDVLGWGGGGGDTGVPLPASGGPAPQPSTQQTQPQPTSPELTTPTAPPATGMTDPNFASNADPNAAAQPRAGGDMTDPNFAGNADPNAAPRPRAAGVDPNQALSSVQQAFQTKFNRPMNAQEQAEAIRIAQQNGWTGGGMVPQSAIDAVMAAMGTYNPAGAQPGGQPGPTQPGGGQSPGTQPAGIDPTQAQQQVTQAFMQRFGKQPTPQELQWLIQMSGYSGSGMVPQDVMTRAMDAVARYTGNMQEPINVTTPANPAESAANRLLEEILGQQFGSVDLTKPEFAQQIQANQLRGQRSRERKQAELAERAAARGAIGAGGYDVDTERLLTEQGEQEQAFESDLIASGLTDQKNRMMQGLQLALQTGQTEKARELQEKLAALEIDLRRYLGKGQLALGLLGQQNQNNQFYDQLGLNIAALQNAMNNQAISALFAGAGA